MSYKKGDIVLVKVIFSEGSGTKKRPALIISDEYYHNNRQKVIIAAITSNIERILPGDTKIKEWKKAGLKFPSLVTGIIQTFKKDIIERRLGDLALSDLLEYQSTLRKTFGF
ncbi:MAG: type II toxin-antitoxin system PemK/MazF family toxin [Atribacterota bacterium]|jgi:mRNA interferase MazF|nr:type II toxin-antitoxin system PemK/MazF family toxin [Atribacterota bacterium]MDD5637973.1 type II toxin-antitoxin system PemK/MazF family toxin [Atribacterota bacterium]